MDNFFEELKEWSARKHTLLTNYLTGFTQILGGSTKSVVYYVDGFAGPGLYGERNQKGSAVLAAEYALSLVNKSYSLKSINVELDDEHFQNLVENTVPYQNLVTNLQGTFAQHVDKILATIGPHPTLFFLDPFGVKGMEWQAVSKILRRSSTTEILLRVDQKTIRRLAGFSGSTSPDAQGKRDTLNRYYGFSDSTQWEHIWHTQGISGLIELYMRRLGEGMNLGVNGKSIFVCSYPIRSIEGDVKYGLIFATRHAKGAVLMNDTVYNREETYERAIEEYRDSQPRQLSMFDSPKPTVEEIFTVKVDKLKEDIWQKFQGKTASRLTIRQSMLLEQWFGKSKGPHFTRAFREMREDGRITKIVGQLSDDDTLITFKA